MLISQVHGVWSIWRPTSHGKTNGKTDQLGFRIDRYALRYHLKRGIGKTREEC